MILKLKFCELRFFFTEGATELSHAQQSEQN